MLSDLSLFGLGYYSTNYDLHLNKITFGAATTDWSNKIQCYSSYCDCGPGESFKSNDNSKIYSFFVYGNPRSAYFITFNLSDGNVIGSKYKLFASYPYFTSSMIYQDYFIITMNINSNSFLIYFNTITSIFTYKLFSGKSLSQVLQDPYSTKIIVLGEMSNLGYISKFYPQEIAHHPDFTAAGISFNVISTSTDSIIQETGVVLNAATSEPKSDYTYTSVSVSYSSSSSNSYDHICFQTDLQSFSISENNEVVLNPDLPCSSSSYPIAYSIGSYSGGSISSFVTVNSSSGVMKVSSPNITDTTTYLFSINSNITGISNFVQKPISLIVNKCTVNHCKQCNSTDITYCNVCKSDYISDSGVCYYNRPSSTAQGISITTQAILGTAAILTFASGFVNASSISGFWSMVNQLQLFFLLLITGSFVPKDIETVITGVDFDLYPLNYLRIGTIGFIESFNNYFNFDLTDSRLKAMGITSDSCIINTYSFFVSLFYLFLIHCMLLLIMKILCWLKDNNKCIWIICIFNKIVSKLLIILTFGYYNKMFYIVPPLI